MFVSPSAGKGSGFDGVSADWSLTTGTSPCIDAGDPLTNPYPATDLGGNPRIVVCRIDMGAYENQYGISDPLQVSISGSNTLCFGDSTRLNASGATTYTWSPSAGLSCTNCANPEATPTVTTTYTVIGSSGICEAMDTITITVNTLPVLTIGNSLDTLTISGAKTYMWSTGSTNDTTIIHANGTYYVTGTDSNGCKSVDSIVMVSTTVSKPANNLKGIAVYPMPSDGNMTVMLSGNGYVSLKIIDELGREVYSQPIDAGKQKPKCANQFGKCCQWYLYHAGNFKFRCKQQKDCSPKIIIFIPLNRRVGMDDIITIGKEKVHALGLGTYQLTGRAGEESISNAIRIGYRHIDTARFYRNEAIVGNAVRNSGIDRKEFFVTTKIWPTEFSKRNFIPEVEASLRELNIGYIDLLLLHWPADDYANLIACQLLNRCLDKGYTRLVGVSNFSIKQLESALEITNVFCNQVEYNPYHSQKEMLECADDNNLMVTAYHPLAKGKVSKDATLISLGDKYGKSAIQIALRWFLQQKNVSPIPKAGSEKHLIENRQVFDFSLTEGEMEMINGLA